MPAHKQFIGYSPAQAATYVGYQREIIVETGTFALRVMDGVTPGGFRIAPLAGTISMVAGKVLGVNNSISIAGVDGKTLTLNKNLTLDGADGTTITFQGTDTYVGRATADALTNKTYNGLTITPTTGTITIANGKTVTQNNSITYSGTDGTTMTFPSTSATLARTDNSNTFAGSQTFNNYIVPLAGLQSGIVGPITAANGALTTLMNFATLGLKAGTYLVRAIWGTSTGVVGLVYWGGAAGSQTPIIITQNFLFSSFSISGQLSGASNVLQVTQSSGSSQTYNVVYTLVNAD